VEHFIMSRPPRTDAELVAVSEHLHYEITMFFGTANALAIGLCAQGLLANVFIESFTLHARALLAFFYSDKPREDDVVAEDYVTDWGSKRPVESPSLHTVHTRVGKEVAHLTYARLWVAQEAKRWRFLELAKELGGVVNAFLELVSDKRLGPLLQQYKANVR
jgi:hypothetical protein